MNILILGGTSFTGPYTVRYLVEQGHHVTVFHRGQTSGSLPSGVKHLHGSIENLQDSADAFRALTPDVVVNMLCFTEENAGTFMETFRGIVGRAVVISSADVYRSYGGLHRTEPGPLLPMPLTEDSPLREKLSPDGEAYNKTGVERIVGNDPYLPVTILRFPAVYGPHDGVHRLYPYVRRFDDGRKVLLLDSAIAGWRFTHGYVENVGFATALAATCDAAAGRVYNVGEEMTPTREEWARRIGDADGWTGRVVVLPRDHFPESLVLGGDFSHDLALDTSRLRRELGYREVVSEDEALRRTIAWERDNPPAGIDPKNFDYASEDAVLTAAIGRTGET
jgi:nucleoside-diphosphate-sugar epimerase